MPVADTSYSFFFFNDTATTEIYTLSLHDALPICRRGVIHRRHGPLRPPHAEPAIAQHREGLRRGDLVHRSEEHTSELQSPCNLVCRLLLEKKKNTPPFPPPPLPSSSPTGQPGLLS